MAVSENELTSFRVCCNVCPDVLYQEYRDTSKQQEIEQRRQRDGLPAAGSGVVAAPALQLQLRNNSHSLSLWQNLEAVKDSGLLQRLEPKEVIVQEVLESFSSESMFQIQFFCMDFIKAFCLRVRSLEMATQSDLRKIV